MDVLLGLPLHIVIDVAILDDGIQWVFIRIVDIILLKLAPKAPTLDSSSVVSRVFVFLVEHRPRSRSPLPEHKKMRREIALYGDDDR